MIDAIQFSSFSDFLNMGGYAFNVWAVYFLFALFLLVNILSPVLKRKQIMRDLKRRINMSNISENRPQMTDNVSGTDTLGESQ